MFDDFYGLTGRPFQLTPDPAFYFESATHRSRVTGWWDGGPRDEVDERADDD